MDHEFGKLLQKTRTDRGLSIEQAAAAVRIRSTFLRSLEAGDLTKFPNAAYAKSFLLMYGRYLGVDVKSIAVQIDTTTQMKVEGYQYLTNRAAGQPKPKADPELTFSAAPAPKSSGSWLPLIVLAGTLVLALIVFVVWQNMNRLSDMQQEGKASTSLFQRRLKLGYTRAARILDILEDRGYVGPGDGAKPREILRQPDL